jgi:hypothetical protein
LQSFLCLGSAAACIQIREAGESLHALALEVAIGHRMPENCPPAGIGLPQ